MAARLLKLTGMVLALTVAMAVGACSDLLPRNSTARAVQPLKDSLVHALADIGSSPGAPMMIRIFKQSSEFEVWKATTATGEFKLLKTYKICAWSGVLGPKITEGDMQAPEGFYMITPALMNPNSNYYLAFNTGFPNKFDTAWGRTGANLMVHGDVLVGRLLLDDGRIGERDLRAGARNLRRRQFCHPDADLPVPDDAAQSRAGRTTIPTCRSGWTSRKATTASSSARRRPRWDVCDKKYVFDLSSPDGSALDATGACPARSNDPLAAQLATREAANATAYGTEVAQLETQDAKLAADKQNAAATLAAEKSRGQSIGGFFSGIFGGGNAQGTAPASPPDTTIVAPTPFPEPNWG